MEDDLNIYYDISSSKWWFFDQSSGTWVEQEEDEVEEYIEKNRPRNTEEKREYNDNLAEVNEHTDEWGLGNGLEQRKKKFNSKTQTVEQNTMLDDSDAQSESEFSYERIVSKGRMIRKLANEYNVDNLNTEEKNENGNSSLSVNRNDDISGFSTNCNGNGKACQITLDNDQNAENESEVMKEGGAGETEEIETNVEQSYDTTEGEGKENIYDNYYGEEYDANTYDPNVNVNNEENGENYYSFYYDNDAGNKYGTENETGACAEGYGEEYNAEYGNNYPNGEEYNVEGTTKGVEYTEKYGAEYNELPNENGNYNYAQTYITCDPLTSENNEEESYKEYMKNDNTNNYSISKEDKVQEQAATKPSLTNKEFKNVSKKEQTNINILEKPNDEDESNSSSKLLRKLSDIDEGINNSLEDKKKFHIHELNNARLLNKLLSESLSFSKSGSKSEYSNSEIHSVNDARKKKITQSNETLTNDGLSENENEEHKKDSKSKVQFSENSVTTQRKSVNHIKVTDNQGGDENENQQTDVDTEITSVPFVRRVTRNLTFKDQGGLSGCIKVFLEKRNELLASSTTAGAENPTRDIDIKMANLKRRARELAKRYRSKSSIEVNNEAKEKTGEAEDGMTKFHKLVLQVQSQNKKLKEVNKGM